MKILIYWNNTETDTLLERVNFAIDELGLNDFIQASKTNEESIKSELNISQEPALIIEEESIEFKDMIFEWIVPEVDEIKSMFISIVWWGDGWSCSSGSCGTSWGWCGSGCSC